MSQHEFIVDSLNALNAVEEEGWAAISTIIRVTFFINGQHLKSHFLLYILQNRVSSTAIYNDLQRAKTILKNLERS